MKMSDSSRVIGERSRRNKGRSADKENEDSANESFGAHVNEELVSAFWVSRRRKVRWVAEGSDWPQPQAEGGDCGVLWWEKMQVFTYSPQMPLGNRGLSTGGARLIYIL